MDIISLPPRFWTPPNTRTSPKTLANLATATSTDRVAVASLTDTVARLSSELAATQSKLVTALMDNAALTKRRSGRGRAGGGGTPGGGRTPGGGVPSGGGGSTSGGGGSISGGGGAGGSERRRLRASDISSDPVHYCWTCGYRSTHPSFLCPTPATGHQRNATKRDTKNGSVQNK